MSEFRDAAAAAAAGTPYTVVDNKDGVDIQIDIANARAQRHWSAPNHALPTRDASPDALREPGPKCVAAEWRHHAVT